MNHRNRIPFVGDIDPEAEELYVFEGAFDAMSYSYITKNCNVIAGFGLSANEIIEEFPDKILVIAYDKNKDGTLNKKADKIVDELGGRGRLFDYNSFVSKLKIPPEAKWKDMNQILQTRVHLSKGGKLEDLVLI